MTLGFHNNSIILKYIRQFAFLLDPESSLHDVMNDHDKHFKKNNVICGSKLMLTRIFFGMEVILG